MIAGMISFKNSIAFRTFIISFILLSVPLLVDSFIVLQERYIESIKDSKHFLLEESSSRVFQLSKVLQTRQAAMLYVVKELKLAEHFPQKLTQEFNDTLASVATYGDFSEVVALKALPGGEFTTVGASFHNDRHKTLQSFEFYEHIPGKQFYKGNFSFIYSAAGAGHYLIFGSPVYSNDQTLVGMVLFSTDITNDVKTLLKSDNTDDYQFKFGILSDTLLVLAATDNDLEKQRFLSLPTSDTSKIQKRPMTIIYAEGHPFFVFNWKNIEQMGALSPIPSTDFYLLAYTDQNTITIFPLMSFLEFYGFFALLLAGGGLVAFVLIRRFSRPFTSLSTVMEGLQNGDLKSRYIDDPLGFEINDLGNAFNNTIDTLIEKKSLAEEEHIKSEIYEKELLIGQQLQRGLLTEKMPPVRNLSIAARYLPAKEVGGDFYDVFMRTIGTKEELVFAVADASGKGVHACFYSLGVRSSLRTFAREYADLTEVMKSTNALFCQDTGDTGMFVTLVVGVLDPSTRTFAYCSLGHNAPVIRSAEGKVVFLEERIFAAGIDAHIAPKTVTLQLSQGDLIVFYTDGITEAQNKEQELFSDQRLLDFIQERGDKPVNEFAEELIAEIKRFERGAVQHDDITLLLVKLEHD